MYPAVGRASTLWKDTTKISWEYNYKTDKGSRYLYGRRLIWQYQ